MVAYRSTLNNNPSYVITIKTIEWNLVCQQLPQHLDTFTTELMLLFHIPLTKQL